MRQRKRGPRRRGSACRSGYRQNPSRGFLSVGWGRMFQQIEGYNPPRWPDPAHPQQAHLDLLVEDLDTGEARALELGARRLDAGGERFRVFTDPAGHPFCLVR